MKYKPYEYQQYATQFILDHPNCCLMLDMGLGKSVITLSALWELLLDRFCCRKVLVIAPLRVAEETWPAELQKWDHLQGLTYSLVLGSEKSRKQALEKKTFLYLINRENVQWLVQNHSWDFDTVVIDELSSFKSNRAQRFKALRKVRPGSSRVIGLTGTPAPNSLMDLWPEMYLLDRGVRLGRFITGYRDRFFVPDQRSREMVYSYKPREGAEQEIYHRIEDICISMQSGDYLEMPELISNQLEVDMNVPERKIYDNFCRDLCTEIQGKELDAVNAAVLSNKLLQMANGAVYDENKQVYKIHDRKLDALEDLIEAANGKPILIAYWFQHDRRRILERFPDARQINTAEDIKNWNKGKIPIALIHPASAGHGLNLQDGGSTIVWFGLTWSLELYQQTNARLWRQGQKNPVVIEHIITKNTIDEDVMKALEYKDTKQAALMNAVQARVGGISNE